MDAKVTKAYTDRIDGSLHLEGDAVELSEARFKELSEGGYVRAIPKPAAKTAKEAASKPSARKTAKPAAKTAKEG